MNHVSEHEICGFYYDEQLKNRSLTVTIHPNTVPIPRSFNGNRDWLGELSANLLGPIIWVTPDDPKVSQFMNKVRETGISGCDDLTKRCYSTILKLGAVRGKDSETAGDWVIPRLRPVSEGPTELNKINWSDRYTRAPILRAILNEDFALAVTNGWVNADLGGNALEGVFNNIRAFAPKAKMLSNAFKVGGASLDEEGNGVTGVLASFLKSAGETVSGVGEVFSGFANNALRMNGTSMKMYGGTDVNFGNLSFKTVIFSEFIPDDETGQTRFVPCTERIKELLLYTSGNRELLTTKPLVDYAAEISGKSKDWVNSHLVWDEEKDTTGKVISKTVNWAKTAIDTGIDAFNKLTKLAGEFIDGSQMFSWQIPPGGFEMRDKDLDCCNKGTLRIVFGGTYTIENLVIRDVSYNFSKIMSKNPLQYLGQDTFKYEGAADADKAKMVEGEMVTGEQYQTSGRKKADGTSERVVTQFGEYNYKPFPLYCELTIGFEKVSTFTDKNLSNFIEFCGMEDIFYEDENSIKKEVDKMLSDIKDKRAKEKEEEIQKELEKKKGEKKPEEEKPGKPQEQPKKETVYKKPGESEGAPFHATSTNVEGYTLSQDGTLLTDGEGTSWEFVKDQEGRVISIKPLDPSDDRIVSFEASDTEYTVVGTDGLVTYKTNVPSEYTVQPGGIVSGPTGTLGEYGNIPGSSYQLDKTNDIMYVTLEREGDQGSQTFAYKIKYNEDGSLSTGEFKGEVASMGNKYPLTKQEVFMKTNGKGEFEGFYGNNGEQLNYTYEPGSLNPGNDTCVITVQNPTSGGNIDYFSYEISTKDVLENSGKLDGSFTLGKEVSTSSKPYSEVIGGIAIPMTDVKLSNIPSLKDALNLSSTTFK